MQCSLSSRREGVVEGSGVWAVEVGGLGGGGARVLELFPQDHGQRAMQGLLRRPQPPRGGEGRPARRPATHPHKHPIAHGFSLTNASFKLGARSDKVR